MLRYLQEAIDIASFRYICSKDPIFGSTILTHWYSHSDNWRDFTAWLGTDGHNKPRYTLMRYGNQYTLCAPQGLTKVCIDELSTFLRLEEKILLCGDGSVLKQLPFDFPTEEQIVMAAPATCGELSPFVKPVENYSQLCELISHEVPLNKERYLGRMFPLFRDRQVLPFGIYEDGQLISCAMLEVPSASLYAVISSVVTHPEYRGNGLASQVVRHLCAVAENMGRVPHLACAEESLTAFYSPLGFEVVAPTYGFLRES